MNTICGFPSQGKSGLRPHHAFSLRPQASTSSPGHSLDGSVRTDTARHASSHVPLPSKKSRMTDAITQARELGLTHSQDTDCAANGGEERPGHDKPVLAYGRQRLISRGWQHGTHMDRVAPAGISLEE